MVCKIRDLINRFCLIVGLAGDDDFGAFLTHLFQDLIDALLEQVSSIGAFRQVFLSALEQTVQSLHAERLCFRFQHRVRKAGIGAQMAGWAVLFHPHFQRVKVTVGSDGDDVLEITAGLPFQPQAFPGAAVEAGQLLFQRDLQALPVHIGKGQHPAAVIIHNDGRDQPLIVEF